MFCLTPSVGAKYNRRIYFDADGKFQHGHELLPCLGSLGEAQSLRVVEVMKGSS